MPPFPDDKPTYINSPNLGDILGRDEYARPPFRGDSIAEAMTPSNPKALHPNDMPRLNGVRFYCDKLIVASIDIRSENVVPIASLFVLHGRCYRLDYVDISRDDPDVLRVHVSPAI
jgi:hypothetical protein